MKTNNNIYESSIIEKCKMAVLGCRRNPQAHEVEECIKCEFKNGMCDVYRVAEKIYEQNYRKVPKDSVVISSEEYEKLLSRPLETMGDLVISKIKEEKCRYFKEIDYGYRRSTQCYAQKCAPEVNCNGCKINCEKYPKIGE